MRTVLLKSRPVLRSRDPPSTLFVQYRIGFGTFLVRKISPSKKPASTHTGGAGIGQYLDTDISGNKIGAVHLNAGRKFADHRAHTVLAYFHYS